MCMCKFAYEIVSDEALISVRFTVRKGWKPAHTLAIWHLIVLLTVKNFVTGNIL